MSPLHPHWSWFVFWTQSWRFCLIVCVAYFLSVIFGGVCFFFKERRLTKHLLLKPFQGEKPSTQPIKTEGVESRNKRSHHMCDLCEKVIIGDLEWTGKFLLWSNQCILKYLTTRIKMLIFDLSWPPAHQKSKNHLYQVRKRRKSEQTTDQVTNPTEHQNVSDRS